MFQRLLALFSVAFLFAACETASNVTGDSASGSSTSSAAGSASASASESATAPSSTTSATQMSDAEKLAQVGNTVYFGFDSAELNGKAQATLDRQAAFLNVNPALVVIVEGHADERGTREYNMALGERRAASVKEFLVMQGVSGDRIEVISFGEERAATYGSDDEAWRLNRRVELK